MTFAFDTDRNPTTGDEGDDYIVDFFTIGSDWAFLVSRRSRDAWQPFHAGLATTPGGIGLTAAAELTRSDLGGTNGFAFDVIAMNFDANGDVVGRDDAPDATRWDFTPVPLAGPQLVAPVVSAPLASPPVAGKSWTISYAITRSDSGEELPNALLRGINGLTTVGTKLHEPAAASFKHGILRLTFKLAASERGQVIRIAIAVRTSYQLGWSDVSYTIR